MNSVDFQVHSKYSFDSLNNLYDIKKRAIKKGIDSIAITDHETLKGGKFSQKYSDENFLFIPGQEIGTEFGDVIGLMIEDEIKSNFFLDVVDEIKDQGGIVYLPHPSRKLTLNEATIKNNIDVIEAVNGRSTIKENFMSIKLSRKLNLAYAAGSDAHTIREIGKVKTVFSKEFYDLDSLHSVLINKKVPRKIIGSGQYQLMNHFQSSLIGTIRTGQYQNFFRGAMKKLR